MSFHVVKHMYFESLTATAIALLMLRGRMQLMRSHRIAPEPWTKVPVSISFPWEKYGKVSGFGTHFA